MPLPPGAAIEHPKCKILLELQFDCKAANMCWRGINHLVQVMFVVPSSACWWLFCARTSDGLRFPWVQLSGKGVTDKVRSKSRCLLNTDNCVTTRLHYGETKEHYTPEKLYFSFWLSLFNAFPRSNFPVQKYLLVAKMSLNATGRRWIPKAVQGKHCSHSVVLVSTGFLSWISWCPCCDIPQYLHSK